MRSWLAFVLIVIGSLALASMELFNFRYRVTDLPWTLALPVAVAAFPLLVRRSWSRLTGAFLLTIWTWSTMGGWTFYIPGWIAAVVAAAQPDPGGSSPASLEPSQRVLMLSRIAFMLTLFVSLATAIMLVLPFPPLEVPWTLAVPAAIAAFPLVVRRSWARLITALLLPVWIWSRMEYWVVYIPGWLAALLAAVLPYLRRRGPRAT